MSVIRVNDVHKKFRVYYDKGSTLKEKSLFKNRNRYEDRWVLRGVSFELEKGEAIGLVGENGCGKSTMLKMLSRIMYPDQGNIEVNGRVSSLIELGAGFHPDMTGRENIYTNAAIFGLTRKEIDARLDDIITFSELGEYIDNPVRTYSSGMYMRLAFSVAINVDADVLLIDEILAVGDANFQAKCFGRLRELKASGVTIVIVTHDTNTVASFCNKAIWISEGKVVAEGKARQVVDKYLQFMNQKLYESMQKQRDAEEQKRKEEELRAKEAAAKAEAREKARENKWTLSFRIDSTRSKCYHINWNLGEQKGVLTVEPGENFVELDVEMKRGENRMYFETDAPCLQIEDDPRKLCFQMINFEVKKGRKVRGEMEIDWKKGVYDEEQSDGGYWRWAEDKGEIIFIHTNREEELREKESKCTIRAIAALMCDSTHQVKWNLGKQTGMFTMVPGVNLIELNVKFEQGENRLHFESEIPSLQVENDPRKLCLQLVNFELVKGERVKDDIDVIWEKGAYELEKNEDSYWRWLENSGEIVFYCTPAAESLMDKDTDDLLDADSFDSTANRFGLMTAEIIEAKFVDEKGKKIFALRQGMEARLEIAYHVNVPSKNGYTFGVGIYTMDEECVYGVNTRLDGHDITSIAQDGKVVFKIENLPLLAGKYVLQVAIEDANSIPLDYIRDYMRFDVVSNERAVGTTFIKHDWIIE